MATRRVTWTSGVAPNTEYGTDADLMSQSQSGNYSTVYYWVGAWNRGSTGAFSNYQGTHTATIAGAGGNGHAGTMPIGAPNGAQRWYDGPWGVNLAHDSAGNRGADTVGQFVRGWFTNDSYGSIGPYPRIPKRPSVPGTPVASHVMPTSLTLTWTASTDNAGSTITGYLVRRWNGTAPTGAYVDDFANNISREISGLTPGATYTFGIYAKNGSADNGGYSNISGTLTVKTIAPLYVKIAGVWVYAVPYVKTGGIWVIAQPFVKVDGVWRATG